MLITEFQASTITNQIKGLILYRQGENPELDGWIIDGVRLHDDLDVDWGIAPFAHPLAEALHSWDTPAILELARGWFILDYNVVIGAPGWEVSS